MSLPIEWRLNILDLQQMSKDGRDATRIALKELIEAGYCKKTPIRGDRGHFKGYHYEISDEKDYLDAYADQAIINDLPKTEKPKTENPTSENPSLINTNRINTNNISENEILDKKTKSESTKTIFTNSDFYQDVSKDPANAIRKYYEGAEYDNIDLLYYFNAVLDWSETKGSVKRTNRGWIATLRTFMRGDMEKNKLKTLFTPLNSHKSINVKDALNYLNDEL